jgi:hypothetical protein
MIVRELGQRLVQAHDVARELHPSRAERRPQEAEGRLALRVGQFQEADPLAHVVVLVHPFAPLGIVDGKQRSGALLGGEGGEESLRRLADRGGGHPSGLEGEQPGHDLAVGGDARERLGQSCALGRVRPLAELLAQIARRLRQRSSGKHHAGHQGGEERPAGAARVRLVGRVSAA